MFVPIMTVTRTQWTYKQIKGTKKSSYHCCVDYTNDCKASRADCNICVFHSEDNKQTYLDNHEIENKLIEMGL